MTRAGKAHHVFWTLCLGAASQLMACTGPVGSEADGGFTPGEYESTGEPLTFDEPQEKSTCPGNKKYFLMTLHTDNYGYETDMSLKTIADNKVIGSWPPKNRNYGRNMTYHGRECLAPGNYQFGITDLFEDGFCCNFGNGGLRLTLAGKSIWEIGSLGSAPNAPEIFTEKTFNFTVPGGSGGSGSSNPGGTSNGNQCSAHNAWNQVANLPSLNYGNLSSPQTAPGHTWLDREKQWTNAHNVRRKAWHNRLGYSYVPLKWSPRLANESRQYANSLVNSTCNGGDLEHAKELDYGENLAADHGSSQVLKTPNSILKRWVENEFKKPYPGKGHLTQVLWRSTQYVGCGEAKKKKGNKICHVQVCRYARPGNCNVGNYNHWTIPAFCKENGCGKPCPPEGCF